MREIKFRVWDEKNRQFYYSGEHEGHLGFFKTIENTDIQQNVLPKIKFIQQFTGLKDKYDQEIYEGDIVRGEVDFREIDADGTHYGDIYTFKGEIIYKAPEFTCEGADFPLNQYNSLEVLGNVYQNPEFNLVKK